MVASFMATHMEGKDENDDLGAHASWFSREYEDAPAPMPDFIMQQKEKKIRGTQRDATERGRICYNVVIFSNKTTK